MGLTQKILLFTSLLVVALVLASLGFTTWQAEKLAQENIEKGLAETKSLWETFQADRFNKLKLGIRTLSNDTGFKALVQLAIDEPSDDTLFNTLGERNQDIGADFILATGYERDRPGPQRPGGSEGRGPLEGPDRDAAARGRGVGDGLAAGRGPVPRRLRSRVLPGEPGGRPRRGLRHQQGPGRADAEALAQRCGLPRPRAPGQPPQLSVSSLGRKEDALPRRPVACPSSPRASDVPELPPGPRRRALRRDPGPPEGRGRARSWAPWWRCAAWPRRPRPSASSATAWSWSPWW